MKDVMKSLLVMVIVIVGYQASAQVEMYHGSYVHSKAVRAKGTKSELYTKAKDWVRGNFDMNKDEVRFKEGSHNIIEIRGTWFHELNGKPNAISYLYTIEVLSGIYRESFKEMTYAAKGRDIPFESKKLPSKKEVISDANVKIKELSQQLKIYIETDLMVVDAVASNAG